MTPGITDSSPALPLEVLELIVQHLLGSDLKRARLASRSLNQICIPPLFRWVTLVPFRSCLERFSALLKSTTLGVHIRKLSYDDRWHHEFWDFCRNLKPLKDSSHGNVVEKFHDHESIAALPSNEIQLLAHVFSRLPKLGEIEILEGWKLTDDDMPPEFFVHFLRELAEDQEDSREPVGASDDCTFERTATRAVLRAMPQDSPACLRLTVCGMDFSHSNDKQYHMDSLAFPRFLRELDLTFVMRDPAPFEESYHPSQIEEVSNSLGSALSHVSSLERLRLRGSRACGDPGTFCDGREPLMRRLVEDQAVFDNLSNLSIQDTPMDFRDLSVFLQRHCGVLRQLYLKNIILVQTHALPTQDCLVALLKLIKSMRLVHFAIGGLLSNGGSQRWHFQKEYDLQTQSDDFVRAKDEAIWALANRWACGSPGYGVRVGGERYPSTTHSRWFDQYAVRSIEKWVVDQNDARACPMERFARQPGDNDYLPIMEERGMGWHVYVWKKEEWAFEYKGPKVSRGG